MRLQQAIVPLFAATLFLGACLMFLLEPMVGRMALPVLGGAPAVWNACVLFFQVSLLAGYGYAHAGTRLLGPRGQVAAYGAVLLLALLFLPIGLPSASASPGAAPTAWLLAALTTSVGVPFLALATCAPTLQRWFSQTGHYAASDPYFLYAASNAGSLLALMAYPALVEPLLPLSLQRHLWTAGFVVFCGAVLLCAGMAGRLRGRMSGPVNDGTGRAQRTGWPERFRWILLAAVPSSLMLGVTSYLTTDIAAVPLLWVGPLAIYLLSFVLAFGASSAYWTAGAARRLPLLVAALAAMTAAHIGGPLWLIVPIHLGSFALAAQACHGRLAAERPPVFALTEYYIWIAVGGSMGGFFNTFLAPLLFNAVVEYPLALVLATALSSRGPTPVRLANLVRPVAVGVVTAALLFGLRWTGGASSLLLPALGVPAVMAFSLARHPVRFAAAIGAMLTAAALVSSPYGHVLESDRTFFGIYRVTADAEGTLHSLYHGTTLHGVQASSGPDRHEPLTYYHREGPIGQAFATLPVMSGAADVAVVGLGVGSLAAYAGPDQRWTFYEIDPAVERIARTPAHFTHLKDCGQRCRVVLGDARFSLSEAGERYAVIVLDAFSSDAIPVHLITREAIAVYLDRLTDGGILAFHISNRHLNLGPVLSAAAADAGLFGVEQQHNVSPDHAATGRSSSRWVLLTRERPTIDLLLADTRWMELPPAQRRVWTDDFSNILSAFRF